MTDHTIDLHGCTYKPFPAFDEETTYLERVTCVDRREARKRMANEYGMKPLEFPVEEQSQETSDAVRALQSADRAADFLALAHFNKKGGS